MLSNFMQSRSLHSGGPFPDGNNLVARNLVVRDWCF
jgi:hypothetical protein